MLWIMRTLFVVAISLTFTHGQDVGSGPTLSTLLEAGSDADAEAGEIFTVQPLEMSYVSAKRPATLRCTAKEAADIHIKCNRNYILDSEITKTPATINGQNVLTVETQITKQMIFIVFARYMCSCIALLDHGEKEVTSRAGELKIARLDKLFPQAPIEVSAKFGESGEMICRAPKGFPEASIYWKKDNVRIETDPSKYVVTNDGSLIIQELTYQDVGNYTCVAFNDFYTRPTNPAPLLVYRDGGWSQWSNWMPCDTNCGDGYHRRSRTCTNPPARGRDAKPCDGTDNQSTPCTVQCAPKNGGWSSWSAWTECDYTQCLKSQRRRCDNPSPAGSGSLCRGADTRVSNCTDGPCGSAYGDRRDRIDPNKPVESQNIILWVILCAAVAVFAVILVIIVMCLMKRRTRRGNGDEDSSNDADSGASRDAEKFDNTNNGSVVLPELTQRMPLRHQRSYTVSRTDSVGNTSEKMPMIPSSARPLPLQKEYYMQISPNCDHHDYMQIASGRESSNESGDDKLSNNSSSPESGICNSCDRQSIASGQIPATSEIEALDWGNVNHLGGRLCVADTGVVMTIPEGAVGRNQTEEIFIAALREDKDRPMLLEKQTLLSPVILCGPQETTFNKSLIISFDHCASLKLGQWKLSIYSSNSSYAEPARWERLVTLNQEILHSPVFCQLDNNRCHVMVDQLASRYCLVGESMYGNQAVKQLKLAAFAQPFSSSLDSNIRVYVLPDTQHAFHSVVQQESKLGAKLMDKPKQISFQDGGNSLCLMIDSISNGWVSKMPAQYQEIPFRHVWNAHSNLHCSFAFERVPNQPNSTLSCKIQVYQKSVLSNRQQININGGSLESTFKILGQKDLSSTVTVNTQSSSGCSSMVVLDNREQQVFRLPTTLKKKLANYLDITCSRGNDWRMLAAALSSDRQLNFFASKPSPTEAILDLWEARTNLDEAPVTELVNILRAMGRQDALTILEKDMGNAWV